jgi:uridine kinase
MRVPSRRPHLIAIVGGSGSGKSWLAERLCTAFAPQAERLSLDSFYRDRSHLPPARRARINFDHPLAIEWDCLETVLNDLLAGRTAHVPDYDFSTHSRGPKWHELTPKRLIFLDGLWLLRRASLRARFDLMIYLDCPTRLRLRRRLARDLQSRGRTAAAVREQFWGTVEPMHTRYVAPQVRWADLVLHKPCTAADLKSIESRLRSLLSQPCRAREEITRLTA